MEKIVKEEKIEALKTSLKLVDANGYCEDKLENLNSRIFLPSTQCTGYRPDFLFAFGGEI